MMKFSRRLVFTSLLTTTALAQFNLTLAISELPACSIPCSSQALPAAGCAFEDIPSCFCTNITLQYQVSACIQLSCNRTDQIIATTVSQNLLCKGVPEPSRSADIIRVVIGISAVAFPVIILRLFSRHLVSRIWWDDWAIVACGAIMVPMTFIPIYNALRGFGKHVWDVPPQNITSLSELFFVSQILYVLVQNVAKISIILLFLRIFPDERFRLYTKIALAWMICHLVGFFIAVTCQCIPISAIWDLSVHGKCVNSTAIVYAGAGFSIFEDIVIILLPVRELKNLNLSTQKKVAVIFMFALGSFACVTSMIRLKYIIAYQVQSLDATYTNVDVVIWSVVETYTAVICACLMAIRPLLTKWLPSVFQSTLAGKSQTAYSNSRPNGNGQSAGAIWSRNHGSAIELKSTESGKGWADAESTSHDGGNDSKAGLEVWVTKSVLLDDTGSAEDEQPHI